MGYRPKRKTYDLKFDPAHAGMEITVRDMTSGEVIELPDQATHEALVTAFAGQLASWNLEDDKGKPLPATLEGVLTLDRSLNVVIVEAWLDAVNGVDAPLVPSSPGGGPSPEVPIPMDVL
ncbi:hypothetical protein [Streptomyces sp. CA-111067]|uniref:hypothetical protein n=1 Tax=Streptomyces sp. CA-111067 TaxID=3240046 RepID=UPI003D99346D